MDHSHVTWINREPAVSGQFYPGSPKALQRELERLFGTASGRSSTGTALAVISPHAGYIYSGTVAAEAFMQLDPEKAYDNVFLIGSSHRYSFDGAAVYSRGNFMTPLGIVPVNIKLSRELVDLSDFITDRYDIHLNEHSLEVQLPFLQYRLNKPFQIVPLVIATQQASTCKQIAHHLKPYLSSSNIFIISTDFSHYPDYDSACRIDRLTAEAILTNKPEELLQMIAKHEHGNVPGLSTCLCGWTSVLTLLYMTENMPGVRYKLVSYKNSGDARGFENKARVVGYCAMAVTQSTLAHDGAEVESEHALQHDDGIVLLKLARQAIVSGVASGKGEKVVPDKLSPALLQQAGVFVSLYRQGKLRGCLGRFTPDMPLYELVQEMSVASALHDHRFSPVKDTEIPELKIEISILTPLKKISSIAELELGRHGIYIKKGHNTGTYLPQVAVNTGWSKEEFLEHCSSDKAGIGRNGWKEAELFTYEAIVIREE